jgi:hypothetical protein
MASVSKVVTGLVGGTGLTVSLGAAYLVVRGPFLGGTLLSPPALLASLGGFLVGVAMAAWGLTRYRRL